MANAQNIFKNTFKVNAPANSQKSYMNIFNSRKSYTIAIYIIAVILICVIIYFLIYIVNYYSSECYEKKTLYNYLFDYSNKDICITETEPEPEPVSVSSLISEILPHINKNEVFHIANQDYTYEQSKCKCESYGGLLASKAELIDSYNNGANWNTYGWTDKQTAYYPIQQCEWDKIDKQNNSWKFIDTPEF